MLYFSTIFGVLFDFTLFFYFYFIFFVFLFEFFLNSCKAFIKRAA